MPDQLHQGCNQTLCELIAKRIAENSQQRITFAEYMDLVLYHPQHGYYATNAVNIGTQGDFFTAPHLGADFGELLAEQFVDLWQILGKPAPFTLVEMGAGQGLLAADVLDYLRRIHPTCFEVLQYIIVERAAGLVAEQQKRLQPFVQEWGKLSWQTLAEIPAHSIVGCCFSNELVDALPVHLFTIANRQFQEIYVTTPDPIGTRFEEMVGTPSTPQLAEYFNLIEMNLLSDNYPEGYRSEVNLAALDWLATIADRLQRGYLLTIDYGYLANRYYNPMRSQGTLQCYYHHAHHSDPYLHIGQQDITAHVDFTALERQGTHLGLHTLGFTQQGLFLMALGLGERIAALSATSAALKPQQIQDVLRRREALHLLINPMGMGNFGVLAQSKGLTAAEQVQPLKGLSLPPMEVAGSKQ